MKNHMRSGSTLTLLVVLLLCVLSGCQNMQSPEEETQIDTSERAIEQATETPLDTSNVSETPSDLDKPLPWEGEYFSFESQTLGIVLELPLDWEPHMQLSEERLQLNGLPEEPPSIRLEVRQGAEVPGDLWDKYVGSIFRFAKEDWEAEELRADKIPNRIYDAGYIHILAEDEDTIIVLYQYGGLINYENEQAPGYAEYKTIQDGFISGEYRVRFL